MFSFIATNFTQEVAVEFTP